MKLKNLLPIFSLLIFMGSCKKSIYLKPETSDTVKVSTYSFSDTSSSKKPTTVQKVQNTEDVSFLVMIGNSGSQALFVSLYPEGTQGNGTPIGYHVFVPSESNQHSFTLASGTRFFIRTVTETGATYDSAVAEAGIVGGVVITIP